MMSTCMYNDELAIRCERWCWGRNSSCKPGSGTRCSLTYTPTQGTVPGTSLTCHEHRCRLRECEPTKRMCAQAELTYTISVVVAAVVCLCMSFAMCSFRIVFGVGGATLCCRGLCGAETLVSSHGLAPQGC